jgi:hypothetical protein
LREIIHHPEENDGLFPRFKIFIRFEGSLPQRKILLPKSKPPFGLKAHNSTGPRKEWDFLFSTIGILFHLVGILFTQ